MALQSVYWSHFTGKRMETRSPAACLNQHSGGIGFGVQIQTWGPNFQPRPSSQPPATLSTIPKAATWVLPPSWPPPTPTLQCGHRPFLPLPAHLSLEMVLSSLLSSNPSPSPRSVIAPVYLAGQGWDACLFPAHCPPCILEPPPLPDISLASLLTQCHRELPQS